MITVNLFDDSFRHASCSTGWKTPTHIQYVRDQLEWNGITLFTDGYVNSPVVEQVKSKYKIGWLHEPQCLHPTNYGLNPFENFDFILTCYAPLLKHPKYRFAPYGGVWIPRNEWGLHPKTKLCSMLYGSKLATDGHRIRHEIANLIRPLGIVDFYGYEGEPVDYSWQTKVKVLKDYAFTIVTETCCQDNLFTEILLDCFAMGTIPIFWGCPNIHEFFNIDGIIQFTSDDVDDGMINLPVWLKTNGWDYYDDPEFTKLAIQDNLNRVSDYEITEDWLYHHILKDLA